MPVHYKHHLLGRVSKAYQSSRPDPLLLSEGDTVKVGKRDTEWPGFLWCTNLEGNGGWVPENYLERRGDFSTLRCDYSAAELSITVGENLILHKQESGWYWATNGQGVSGWVPADHIEIID